MPPGQLGNVQVTVGANTAPLAQGLAQAQTMAQSAGTQISSAFNGLQIVPRQLAAINQSIVSLGNNLAAASARGSAFGSGLGSAGRQAQQAFGGAGMAMMQLGAIVDDVQYGFRGVVNNIQPLGTTLATAMGASTAGAMAFGGALGIASVAAYQLFQNWDKIFGGESQLPRLKNDLEGIAESIQKIDKELKPLREAQEQAANGERGLWAGMMDQMGLGDNALGARMRAGKLEELRKQAVEQQKDLQTLKGTGVEGTDMAKKVASGVAKAYAGLPMGSDTLMDILQDRGMSQREAQQALAGAKRGNAGHLDDILAKLTPEEKRGRFAGLVASMPQNIRAGEIMDQFSKMEAQQSDAGMKRLAKEEQAKREQDAEKERIADENARQSEQDARDRARRVETVGGQLANSPLALGLLSGQLNARGKDRLGSMVAAQLKAAGSDVGGSAGFLAMQDAVNKRIEEIMVEKGVGKEEARGIAMEENVRRNNPHRRRMNSESMGIAEFATKLMTGILSQDESKKQTQYQKGMLDQLKTLNGKLPQPAVAG